MSAACWRGACSERPRPNGAADEGSPVDTDDASVVQPGIYKKNNEVIRTTMAAGFAGPLKGSRVIDEPQSVRFLGPDACAVGARISPLR